MSSKTLIPQPLFSLDTFMLVYIILVQKSQMSRLTTKMNNDCTGLYATINSRESTWT